MSTLANSQNVNYYGFSKPSTTIGWGFSCVFDFFKGAQKSARNIHVVYT